jgi:hypothetical protein
MLRAEIQHSNPRLSSARQIVVATLMSWDAKLMKMFALMVGPSVRRRKR